MAIAEANEILPEGEQVADVNEVYYERDLEKVLEIVGACDLKPQYSRHIAFRMMNSEHAMVVEQKLGLKVFWFN